MKITDHGPTLTRLQALNTPYRQMRFCRIFNHFYIVGGVVCSLNFT
jgi:hypothetical protein